MELRRGNKMYDEMERKKSITKLVEQLDITPTLYKNAVEKYNNLAEFLKDKGLEADIYPQGSFALGTVVKPASSKTNSEYDLDFICEIAGSKVEVSAGYIYNQVKDILESDKTYKDRLSVWPNCFTINYADVGETGFSIDIVPATGESKELKAKLQIVCENQIAETAIAIPKCDIGNHYEWITNNPLGYRKWFEKINLPFKENSRTTFRKGFFDLYAEYASIEEIPDDMYRSSLQRVIQILKIHRDNYFMSESKKEMRPKSVIITTLVTEIASHLSPNTDLFELLQEIIQEIDIYANYQRTDENYFKAQFGMRTAITKPNGVWTMPNPANPYDNLVDGWNKDGRLAKIFFQWISLVKEDVLDSLQKNDNEFRSIMENAFGQKNIQRVWKNQYKAKEASTISEISVAKPWYKI